MNNPETRMAAHVARRDAAHPQIPQTVRGMIIDAGLDILPSNSPAATGDLFPCFAIPIGEIVAL